jgi:hypothetical protein
MAGQEVLKRPAGLPSRHLASNDCKRRTRELGRVLVAAAALLLVDRRCRGLGEQHGVDFVGNGATHLVLAEEQTQIVGVMPTDEPASVDLQVAAANSPATMAGNHRPRGHREARSQRSRAFVLAAEHVNLPHVFAPRHDVTGVADQRCLPERQQRFSV